MPIDVWAPCQVMGGNDAAWISTAAWTGVLIVSVTVWSLIGVLGALLAGLL